MARTFPEAPFTFGDTVRDRITGFEGVVVSETRWLNQCHTFGIQPRVIPEGKSPKDLVSFDMVRLEHVTDTPRLDFPGAVIADPFPLGQRLRCNITGFEGIAYAHSRFVYGSSRVALLAEKLKKGEIIDPLWFDEDQLTTLATAEQIAVEVEAKNKPKPADPPRAAEPERRRGSGGPIGERLDTFRRDG